jgi:sensor c-di-GMP phosphodiesterase-like protein
MLAGYLAGRAVALHLAEGMLRTYAARGLSEADTASRESRTLLATLNASPFAFCSDAEIGYFRELIYQSEYLKEAGRMRDGRIYCSATLGRLNQPMAVAKPSFSQADGTKVYKRFAPFKVGELTVAGVQLGDAYVVLNPYPRTHREFPPMHYTSTAKDDPLRQSNWLAGASPQPSWAVLTTDGQARVGDGLYATRCSTRYFNCVTDYIFIPDALRTGRRELIGGTILGGLIGAFFGFAFSCMYRRSKSMERQLRRAISKDNLNVVYQPIVSLVDRRIRGAEALVRWTDEEGLAVGPDVFVKLAEERGFVGAITELVVRRALLDFGETLRCSPGFRLSVNVAAADLSDPKFLPMLERADRLAAVPPGSLTIEITEGGTVQHRVAMETILQLRRQGYSVHIDDFGTGYSSLSYLKDLSVDAIKIDKSFTQAIGTGSVIGSILPQILAIAEALNLDVIVEGIETEEQADYFAHAGAHILAQGWLFGYPVPADEFHRLLAQDQEKALVPECAT